MFRNFIKTAWRHLLKNKAHSFINILGLATGMAITMLIGLWIWEELSFDHYHEKHERIAQVWTTQTWNGETGTSRGIDIPLANELRSRYADNFKHIALSSSIGEGYILAVGEKKITSPGMWVQPELPGMLTLKMLKGTREALKDPSSALLSASLAQTLFGNEDPINKIIRIDGKWEIRVGGVYEDLRDNTTLRDAKFFLSWDKFMTTKDPEVLTQWGNHGYWLFVELHDNIDFDKTTAKIKDIPKAHLTEGQEEILLHPMDKWHLYSEFQNGKVAGGRIRLVWLFGLIGILVLLLACINFMNLSTAKSEKRAKEVGIRKSIGSLRVQLIWQFLCESVMVAFMAFILALLMVLLAIPGFNALAEKQMHIPWGNPLLWTYGIVFTLITGLIAGSYPALYLSGFNAIKVLNKTFRVGPWAAIPRKILVVLQFSVSIVLIIGFVIIYRQIQFAKSRPVGYTREGLIAVKINTPDLVAHYDPLRNDLLQSGVVENVAKSTSPVTDVSAAITGFDWKGKDPNASPLFGIIAVNHEYGKTVGWKIVQGRDFSKDYSDAGAFIINESAAKLMNLSNPVGEVIKLRGQDHALVGIAKDMVMESPYRPVSPTIFVLDLEWANFINVRLRSTVPTQDALAKIETIFKSHNPGSPFEYKFIDEEYAKKFSDEQRVGNLATFFAILAIFISCLGLFGLASFVAEQRTKEIGVRKILGASVFTIWRLLSKEFVVLIIISCLIAIPVAAYYLSKWLQQFQYRTQMSWWIFAAAAVGVLLITILTVSFQTIKAALMSPVKSLKSD